MRKSVSVARKQHKANSLLIEISVVASSRAEVVTPLNCWANLELEYSQSSSPWPINLVLRITLRSIQADEQALKGKPKKTSLDNSQSVEDLAIFNSELYSLTSLLHLFLIKVQMLLVTDSTCVYYLQSDMCIKLLVMICYN